MEAISNDATKKVLAECEAIMNTPIPAAMIDVTKRFIEIVSVLQGQVAGLADTAVDQAVKLREQERQIEAYQKAYQGDQQMLKTRIALLENKSWGLQR